MDLTWSILLLSLVALQIDADVIAKRALNAEDICRAFPEFCSPSASAPREVATSSAPCEADLASLKTNLEQQLAKDRQESGKKIREFERLMNISLTSPDSEKMVEAYCGTPASQPCLVSQWTAWEGPYGFRTEISRTRDILQQGYGCPPINELREVVDLKTYCTGPATPNKTAENFNDQFLNRTRPADIVLLLDSSSSISKPDFDEMKKNVVDLLGMICRGIGSLPSNNRVAIALFSGTVRFFHHLRDVQDMSVIKEKVRNLVHMEGNTATGTAIMGAFNEFDDARPNVAYSTLLITDGQSNTGADIPIAVDLLSRRSSIYCLGVGLNDDVSAQNEISSIVRGNDRLIFSLRNFQDFSAMVAAIRINLQNPQNPCQPLEDIRK